MAKTRHTTVLLSFDGGFSSMKAMALLVPSTSGKHLHVDEICRIKHRSIFAPLPEDCNGFFSIACDDGISGVIGEVAEQVQPSLWQADSTEAHYGSTAQKLYVRSVIIEALNELHVTPGHVNVFLSVSLPGMHEFYANIVREALSLTFTANGYTVTPVSVEVKTQPFWLVVDHLSRWGKNGTLLPFNVKPLMLGKLLVVMDFGSLTFAGAGFIRNLTPVVKWCEPVGSWEQIKGELKTRLQKKAISEGVQLFDPNMQELLSCYETGVFVRGKHTIDMRDEIEMMIAPKVQQRLRIADQQLRGAAQVGDILLAGGDVEKNRAAFEAVYADKIAGRMYVMSGEQETPDPLWRVASGGLKGAIRQYMKVPGEG